MSASTNAEQHVISLTKQALRWMIFIGLVMVLQIRAQGQAVQWGAQAGGNGHFYEAVRAPSGITWGAAQSIAVSRGGYLATITSAAENNFVYGLVSGNLNYWHITGTESWGPWLGGLQPPGSSEPAGGWTWVTGEAFSYQNWAALQPNNNGGAENRIQFHGHNAPGGAATWNDLTDTAVQYVRGYVIESIPEPSVFTLLGMGLLGIVAWRKGKTWPGIKQY